MFQEMQAPEEEFENRQKWKSRINIFGVSAMVILFALVVFSYLFFPISWVILLFSGLTYVPAIILGINYCWPDAPETAFINVESDDIESVAVTMDITEVPDGLITDATKLLKVDRVNRDTTIIATSLVDKKQGAYAQVREVRSPSSTDSSPVPSRIFDSTINDKKRSEFTTKYVNDLVPNGAPSSPSTNSRHLNNYSTKLFLISNLNLCRSKSAAGRLEAILEKSQPDNLSASL